MSLAVYTGLSHRYRGPSGVDVSRETGGLYGHTFAPSRPTHDALIRGRAAAAKVYATGWHGEATEREKKLWEAFSIAYRAEMIESQARHPDVWGKLLARPDAVLLCYCEPTLWEPTGDHCHRYLLRDILVQRGAVYGGELGAGLWPKDRPIVGGRR